MAFTYDVSTSLGQLRLAIGDTVSGAGPRPNAANYTDAELNVFLAPVIAAGYTYGRAVSQVLRLLATEWTNQANISIGEYSAQYGQIAANYRAAAAAADLAIDNTGAGVTGGITVGTMTLSNQVYTVNTNGTVT